MIKISNIKKQYGKQTIFNDLSYEFPPKGMIAICGPSGCGKSTLLNILSGLLPPDSGKVIHEKTDLYSLNDDKLSIYRLRHFGFVFQDFKLFETETVFHNITLPLDSLSKVSKRTKERKVLIYYRLFISLIKSIRMLISFQEEKSKEWRLQERS